MYFIAETLGRTFDEISDMSVDEYLEWRAYFKIKAQINKPKNKGRRTR